MCVYVCIPPDRSIPNSLHVHYPHARTPRLQTPTPAPYKVGVAAGIGSALLSIPLVFHLDTVIWFNETFVHHDLPDGGLADLNTFWKVGSFAWYVLIFKTKAAML